MGKTTFKTGRVNFPSLFTVSSPSSPPEGFINRLGPEFLWISFLESCKKNQTKPPLTNFFAAFARLRIYLSDTVP